MFYLEYVPEALAADDVAGVGTKLLAEAGDVDIDGAIGNNCASPDGIHELLAGTNLTTSRQQLA